MNYLLLAEHVAEPAAAALNYAVLAAALAAALAGDAVANLQILP